jgi:hypothetical protein
MSYKLTGGFQIVRQLQYVEEVTEGTTPTSPTFIHAGPITELNDNQETQAIKYRQIGNRDIYAMIKTGELYSFDVTFNPLDIDLISYAINKEDTGTKNIGKSLSFLTSQLVDGTEMYKIYKGARAESIDVNITAEGMVEVTISYICQDITTPSLTHGLGTPVWGTNPTAVPWTNFSGGTGPLRIDADTVAFGTTGAHGFATGKIVDTDSFSFSCTHNLERVKVNGETIVKWVMPTFRDITFEFDTLYHDTTLIADQKSLTSRRMEYALKSNPGATLDFDKVYMETIGTSDSTTATEPKHLSITGDAQSVAVRTVSA